MTATTTAPAAVPATTNAAPVLKWAGGKTRLLPELLRRVPRHFGRYHEPFAGGAALFFALAREGRLANGAVLSDVNPDVVNLYRALQWDVEAVIVELRKLERSHRRNPAAAFDRVRAKRNRSITRLTKASTTEAPGDRIFEFSNACHAWAAQTLYLNRTCFNGLWRVNRAGAFNVPIGAYDHKHLDIVREDELRAVAREVSKPGVLEIESIHSTEHGNSFQYARLVEIQRRDYLSAFTDVRPGDLVYCDPPYVPVSATANFVGYAAGGFDEVQQHKLAAALALSARCGVHVIASNADTPLAREIYTHPDLMIDAVDVARAINSKGGGRGKVGELIVTSRHSSRV